MGRPLGATSRVTRLGRAFAQQFVESADYRASVERRIKNDTLPPGVETMLWHYAYGKPKDVIDVNLHEDRVEQDLADLSEDQLAERASEIATEIAVFAQAQREQREREEAEAAATVAPAQPEAKPAGASGGGIPDPQPKKPGTVH